MENEKEYSKGLIRQKRSFSLVWIIPIVAIIITAGMIYKSYVDQGTRIYITIEDGSGIIDGKTPLMYKGIQIGSVVDVRIKEDDVSMLQLTVVVDKASSAAVAREGNKFWKVESKISVTEITGLDTIIRGVYIAVMPATTTKKALIALPYQTNFIALESAPVDVFRPGLALKLNTINKGDISVGAPILYNKQVIGKVEDKQLSKDRSSVDLFIRIDGQYSDLIHEKSLFYKVNAIEVKASLTNIEVTMGSFASFIAGGISVHNTDMAFDSAFAKEKQAFLLHDNYNEIMLSEEEVVLIMQSHSTLAPDISKVYYKGVEAGFVKGVDYNAKKDETRVSLKLHKDFRRFANEKAYFWLVEPKLNFDGVEGLDAIVRGNYINFSSSNLEAKKKSSFILNDKKPKKQGVKIKLIAQDIQSLKEGAGVFYHSIEIGVIDSYTLNKDKETFTVNLIIKPKYANLVNASSLFYHNSGVSFEASLSKVVVQTGSLETMLRGGIAVDTSSFKTSKKLKKSYVLYENNKAMIRAQYLAANGIYLTLVASRAGSLKVGSPLLYKQIKVGEVLSTKWDNKTQRLYLKVFVIEEYAKEVHADTLFYNASGVRAKIDLNGLQIDTESIETIVAGGISFFSPYEANPQQAKAQDKYILYETKTEAKNTYFYINILADDSYGLKLGSVLQYKKVNIGKIESIKLRDKNVLIKLQIDAQYKNYIRKDTIFWIEKFELGLSGVKNPSAALTGPSLTLMPGISEEISKAFKLRNSKPLPHFHEEGLRVILKAPRLSNLKKNTSVFFRQVKIGSVVEYHLNKDATGLDIEIFIEPCFAHLIRKNSYFYNASGIGMEVSLFGAKIKTESVESILTGGIGVLTPDDYKDEAQNNEGFTLHETFDKDALTWSPQLHSVNEMCK